MPRPWKKERFQCKTSRHKCCAVLSPGHFTPLGVRVILAAALGFVPCPEGKESGWSLSLLPVLSVQCLKLWQVPSFKNPLLPCQKDFQCLEFVVSQLRYKQGVRGSCHKTAEIDGGLSHWLQPQGLDLAPRQQRRHSKG